VQTKLWFAVAVICTLLPFAGQFYGDRSGGWLAVDFRAYYCAALAQREGLNPYYAQSIHQCERDTPAPYYRASGSVTVPAPYPPYALALFYPLTFLPFGAAAALWWLVLFAGIVLAAWALARTTALPWLVGWAVLALSAGLASLSSGNVVSFAVGAVVLCAFFAQKGRTIAAAVAAAVAMVEPQIGVPVVAALFVFAPGSRLVLAGAFAAFGLLSLWTAGFAQTLSYMTAVVPAHALSEVSRDNQYSVATVLSALGTPDATAALAGSISYLVMASVGVVVALRLARRYDEPALVVLLPPAVSLLGGAFVHTGEIAMAAPACLLLFARSDTRRARFFCALMLLAVPWILATSIALFLAPVFPVAYLAHALLRGDRTIALAAGVVSFAVIAGLFALSTVHGGPAIGVHHHAYPPIDPRLAEASWRQLVLGNSTNRPIMWLLRLPTWIGLIVLTTTAIALACKTPLAAASRKPRLLESGA
jgi:alpha-1,2-mannosyltransferase